MNFFFVIGEMVDKLSEEIKRKHPEIEWIKIKGFRNIVAHDYFGIDAEEVWSGPSARHLYNSSGFVT
jgi:uncharacterized protein with HEPN domain